MESLCYGIVNVNASTYNFVSGQIVCRKSSVRTCSSQMAETCGLVLLCRLLVTVVTGAQAQPRDVSSGLGDFMSCFDNHNLKLTSFGIKFATAAGI